MFPFFNRLLSSASATSRASVSHRLKLLAPRQVNGAFREYRGLVFRETALPVKDRPLDPGEVDRARDHLIQQMVLDVQLA